MAELKGSKTKLRAYFLAHVGEVLSYKQLQDVAGGVAEFGRRIRELRNEEGWAIVTHRDRDDLKPGEYMLESLKQRPAFARNISNETRACVLDRNGYTCQMCGLAAGDIDVQGRRVRLCIGHIVDKSAGGSDDPGNLRALCTKCNEGASNVTLPRPELIKLLAQVRRATAHDQMKVLRWLIKKFPSKVSKRA
ncbi:MAG: HNH endonuclease [bacterium]